jgi:hypothetical protein
LPLTSEAARPEPLVLAGNPAHHSISWSYPEHTAARAALNRDMDATKRVPTADFFAMTATNSIGGNSSGGRED